jgi:hypothetical protein
MTHPKMSDKPLELTGAPEGNSPKPPTSSGSLSDISIVSGRRHDAMNDSSIQKYIQKKGLESCPVKSGAKKYS